MELSPPHLQVSVSRTRLLPSAGAGARAGSFVGNALLAHRTSGTPSRASYSERVITAVARRVEGWVRHAVVHASSEVEVICRIEEGRATGIEVEVVCRCDDGRWQLPSLATPGSHGGDDTTAVPLLEQRLGSGRCGPVGFTSLAKGTLARRSNGCTDPGRRDRPAEYSLRFRVKGSNEGGASTPHDGACKPSLPTMQARKFAATLDAGQQRGALRPSFLEEARELLTGQVDEDQAAARVGQILVPRIADWYGVWLTGANGSMQLSHVWHVDERRVQTLWELLGNNPPSASLAPLSVISLDAGQAWVFPLVTNGSYQGMFMLGTAEGGQIPDMVMHQIEQVARLLAQAVATARQYARPKAIGQTPWDRLSTSLPYMAGLDASLLYEQHDGAQTASVDFFDFRKRDGRWCFLLGEAQANDREAMPLLRSMMGLLAGEGCEGDSMLERLNTALLDRAKAMKPDIVRRNGQCLSLLYGEVRPNRVAGGVHCRLASAGHHLPLKLSPGGTVEPAAQLQTALGVHRGAQFKTDMLDLTPGELLLCVTAGMTKLNSDGLSRALSQCTAMDARAAGDHVLQSLHGFSTEPLEDGLGVLVLKALPLTRSIKVPRSRLPCE